MIFSPSPEEFTLHSPGVLLHHQPPFGDDPGNQHEFQSISGNHLLPTAYDDIVAQNTEQIRRSNHKMDTSDGQTSKQREPDNNNQDNTNRQVGGNGRDTLSAGHKDKLFGKGGKDVLTALDGRGHNYLGGGRDNDILYGKINDKLLGGSGRDYLDASQGKRKNLLKGGKGEDELLGSFSDRLFGNNGDDILWAGQGKNRLKGGKGADQFWIVDGKLPRRRNEIKDFEVGVDLLGVSASNEIRSFTDLAFVQQGNNTLIQFNGRDIVLLKQVNADSLTSQDVLFDPVFVPAGIDATTTTTITLESRAALFQNEIGAFFTDDAEGRIGNLKPGDKGYAAAALSPERRLVVFAPNSPSGTQSQLQLRPDQYLGWYLIQDSDSETFLRENPKNKLPKNGKNKGNKPLAFFSFVAANPDGIDHLQYRSENQLGWEDLTNGGDRSFDDAVFNVDFSFVRDQVIPVPPNITESEPTPEPPTSPSQNSIPVAQNDTYDLDEDTTLQVGISDGLLSNDQDGDDDSLTAMVVEQPANGSLNLNANGSFSYTPNPNFNGSDHFTYMVNDGQANSNPVKVSLNVSPVNDEPQLTVPGKREISSGKILNMPNIRVTDIDAGQRELRVIITATNGTVNLNANAGTTVIRSNGDSTIQLQGTLETINTALSSLIYRSNQNFTGNDTVTVTVTDQGATGAGGALSDTKTVPISVSLGVLDPISVTMELMNDSGISDSDRITSDPTILGTVDRPAVTQQVLAGFGSEAAFDITSSLQDNGEFTLTEDILTAINGEELVDGTYTLQIKALDVNNQESEVFTLTFQLDRTAPLAPALDLASGYGTDNETFLPSVKTVGQTEANVLVELQENGAASVSTTEGQFSFNNVDLAEGSNSLTTIATDAAGNQSQATTTINRVTINPIDNAAPEIVSTPETLISTDAAVYRYQVQATDADGDVVSYQLISGPAGATLDADTGSLVWELSGAPPGTYSFSVQAQDSQGGADTQHFEVSLEAPSLTGGSISGQVWNDLDGDGQREGNSEPGLAGVEVYLDLNNNSQPDGDEPVQLSATDNPETPDIDETGQYAFTGLEPGQYVVRQVVPEGYEQTAPISGGYPNLTVAGSETFEILDFGNQLTGSTSENRAPIFISDPLENFSIPLSGAASGDVAPEFLNLSLGENETFFGSVSITLPEQGAIGGSADIVFIVDESRSMAGEHEWLTDMVLELNTALEARGITDNRYSLLGFAGTGNDAGVRNLTLPGQPEIQIYGPGNQLIDVQSPSPSRAEFSLPGDGDYTVVLTTGEDATANYDLQFNVTSDVAVAPSGFNQILGQTIAAGGSQTFSFEAPAGLKVWFDSITSTSRNIQGTLLTADGEVVATVRSDRDSGPFSLPKSGTYTLVMNGGNAGGEYSFQLLDMTNAPSVVLDTPINGTVDSEVTQVFQFSGELGQQVYFNSTVSGVVFSDWALYGPDNGALDSGGLTSDLEAILPGNGTYWLVIRGEDSAARDYAFQAVTPTIQVAPIGFSEVVNSSISEAGEFDIYQFEGQAGQGIWFDGLFAETLFGPGAALFSPDGDRLFSTIAENDQGILTLPTTGTYSLVVGGNDDIGDYSFQLLNVDAAPSITVGEPISGTLTPGKSATIYTIEGAAGQSLLFDITDVTGSSPGNWKLFSPGNSQVLQNNRILNNPLNEDFEVVLPADGEYHLVLTGRRNETVDYTFQVESSGSSAVEPTGFGVVNSGTLTANNATTYTFEVPAGTRVWFDSLGVTSSSIRANLTDPNGVSVFSDTRLSFADPDPYVLEASGLYTLTVSGGTSGGDYSFRILNFEDATPLPLDTQTEVTLPLSDDTQLYQFEGNAGTRLYFDLDQETASSFTGSWNLFYPGSGQASNSEVSLRDDFEVTLPGDGTYVLALESRSSSSVNLSFQVVTPETQAASLDIGESIAGSLDEAGEIDRYTFTGTKGQKIWIDGLTASSEGIVARLVGPTGSQLFGGGNRLVSPTGIQGTAGDQSLASDIGPVTLTEDGVYTLQITGGDTTGAYSFRIDDLTGADILADGTNLVGSFDSAGSTQVFRLNDAESGQTLTFSPPADLFFSNVTQLSQDTERLLTTRGGTEDGYAGLNSALQLSFRSDAAVNLILVTDEARDNTDPSLTFDTIRSEIEGQDALLSAILNAQFEDENGVRALGIDADGNVYIPDGAGSFVTSQGGSYTGSVSVPLGNTATIKEDYVDLAFAVDGATWDLNQLRSGGDAATSFTKAFVELQAESLSEQFLIDVESADSAIAFSNLTGPLAGLGSGDTANFDIEITGDGNAQSFELLFTRPESGFILGSIPVVLNQAYQYPALATDPDGDPLTYSLLQAPDGATIDSATGAIFWNPPAVGSYDFSIQADDGRGGTAVQDFMVVVNAVNSDNQAPTITSTPAGTEINTNQTFVYDVDATDPDSDTLSYYLASGPSGLQIDRETGEISWSPTEDQVGVNPVEILVLDGKGKEATQQFEVVVNAVEPNLSPFFASAPVRTALAGDVYQYRPIAIDPEGESLTYSLSQQPDGMVIDADMGNITWQPGANDVGDYNVVVAVEDSAGNISRQTYELTVLDQAFEDAIAPILELGFSSNLLDPGESATLQIRATDNIDLASLSLELEGNPLTLVPDTITNGQLYTTTIQLDTPGVYTVVGTAADSAGNIATESFDLRVFDPSDIDAPEVTFDLSGLQPGAPISAPFDILGTVSDQNLDFYRIEYAPTRLVDFSNLGEDNPSYVVLTESDTPADGVLGTLDPRFLNNDEYFVRVVAQDVNGKTTIQGFAVGVATENKVGNFTLDATDLNIPLTGIPITVSRRYDTLQANTEGSFGYGWELVGADARISESVPVTDGDGFASLFTSTPFTFGTRVTLTNPSGERVGFTFEPEPVLGGLLGTVWAPKFTPDPGVDEVLEVDNVSLQQNSDGTFRLYLFGFSYNPNEYRLTTKENLTYTYDQFDGLQSITDLNGNTLTYSDDGIFSSTGEAVVFNRDEQDRITSIVDPAGNSILYGYDDNGDLISVTNQAGNVTQYVYDPNNPHYLIEEIDPLGRSSVRTEYDDQGRVSRIIDGDGNALELDIEFGAGGDRQLITDPLGNTTILFYDQQGNITQEIDAEGGITQYTYDDDNNLTSVTDPRGFTTTYTYDDRGNLLSITDASGSTRSFTYDDQNNLLTDTNELGRVTEFVYDAQGNLVEIIDAAGGSVTFDYDTFGRVERFTDANGNFSLYDYAPVSGSGVGALALSKPTKVTFADGSTQEFSYNAFGQVTRVVDENGHATEYITDNTGRLITLRDPLGNETNYTYEAQYITQVINALGETARFEYDGSGNLIRQVDPAGGVTEFEYDSLGREIRETVYLSTTDLMQQRTTLTTYRADGLIESIADGAGNITRFEYDLVGNQTAVIDPLGQRTEFVYDNLNRQIQKIDPLGNVTTYEYDDVGNIVAIVDSNGRRRSFTYDELDRLDVETWLDGSNPIRTIDYDYDAVGNLTGVFDPDSSLTFFYNNRDRLEQVDYTGTPGLDGVTLTYTYDGTGNVLSVVDNFGTEVTSTYDPRNLLTQREWQGGGVDPIRADFIYNPIGDLTTVTRYADLAGTQKIGSSSYTYDAAQRLIGLTHRDGSDQILADYAYALNAAGELIQETRNDETFNYSYDDAAQLVQVEHSGGASETYNFDANGNRESSSVHGNEYVTGDNNRLESDGIYNYDYDNEGNLIRRTETATGEVREFTWDYRNRLVSITDETADGRTIQEITYTYDAFDRRLSETINGKTTHFVSDGATLWAELNDANEVIARYLPGTEIDELLARYRTEDGTAWHLTDRLNTVRGIVDAVGDLINEIEYDSFGRKLSETNPEAGDRFGFTGREYDEDTGLYYYRARYYAPELGRFINQDPIGFEAADTNLYRYVSNSPINATDPTGTIAALEYAGITDEIVLGDTGEALGAFIGFLQGFANTQLVFIGNILDIANSGGDILSEWGTAIGKTQQKMEEIELALKLLFLNHDEGLAKGFVDGTDAGGGFSRGYEKALFYLEMQQPE
ncbi:MAG: tandem-95 repeat protein [Elainellaceae cyanobacterium]